MAALQRTKELYEFGSAEYKKRYNEAAHAAVEKRTDEIVQEAVRSDDPNARTKAEADLERKWPAKYNAAGHLTWAGRLYGSGMAQAMSWWTRRRIYHGTWGSALFQ